MISFFIFFLILLNMFCVRLNLIVTKTVLVFIFIKILYVWAIKLTLIYSLLARRSFIVPQVQILSFLPSSQRPKSNIPNFFDKVSCYINLLNAYVNVVFLTVIVCGHINKKYVLTKEMKIVCKTYPLIADHSNRINYCFNYLLSICDRTRICFSLI